MTLKQRKLAMNQAQISIGVNNHLMEWFTKHPAFKHIPIPEECPQLFLIPSPATENNTDEPANHREVEHIRSQAS